MRFKSLLKQSSFIAFALAGLLMGDSVYAAVSDGNTTDKEKAKVEFPKNESGETFGSSVEVDSFKDWPDLVLATGVGDKIGYVRKSDLDEDMPKSPEEALAKQAKQETRVIKLYESDGKTVIGKFEITPPKTDIKEEALQKIEEKIKDKK